MGVLGAVAHSPESLEIDLDWIEAEVGDKPYGVDVIIPASLAGGPDGGHSLDDVRQLIPGTHVDFVDEILARYEVPPLPVEDCSESLTSFGSLGDATPFSADAATAQLKIALGPRRRVRGQRAGARPRST